MLHGTVDRTGTGSERKACCPGWVLEPPSCLLWPGDGWITACCQGHTYHILPSTRFGLPVPVSSRTFPLLHVVETHRTGCTLPVPATPGCMALTNTPPAPYCAGSNLPCFYPTPQGFIPGRAAAAAAVLPQPVPAAFTGMHAAADRTNTTALQTYPKRHRLAGTGRMTATCLPPPTRGSFPHRHWDLLPYLDRPTTG